MADQATEKAMASKETKTPGMFDPEALLAAQRRNYEALTSAGRIVAEGMQTYAQRQAAMMQDAMRNLWGEMETRSRSPQAAADPADQLARMRGAFEKVMAQVRELTQLLIKTQSEAMNVLNACAAANLEALGGMAPDLANLQKMATEAMQNATRQTTAAVEEMQRRMADLEQETRAAMSGGAAGGASASGKGEEAADEGGAKRGGAAKRKT